MEARDTAITVGFFRKFKSDALKCGADAIQNEPAANRYPPNTNSPVFAAVPGFLINARNVKIFLKLCSLSHISVCSESSIHNLYPGIDSPRRISGRRSESRNHGSQSKRIVTTYNLSSLQTPRHPQFPNHRSLNQTSRLARHFTWLSQARHDVCASHHTRVSY